MEFKKGVLGWFPRFGVNTKDQRVHVLFANGHALRRRAEQLVRVSLGKPLYVCNQDLAIAVSHGTVAFAFGVGIFLSARKCQRQNGGSATTKAIESKRKLYRLNVFVFHLSACINPQEGVTRAIIIFEPPFEYGSTERVKIFPRGIQIDA